MSIQNVDFTYGSDTIFKNLNLTINKKDFIGITGENGSGKSTLIKIMIGELEVNSGEIKLFGKSVKGFKDWSKIGYVPQMGNSTNRDFPATAKEAVMLNLYSDIGFMRMPKKRHRERAIEALTEVGMEEFADRQIKNLSGGQYQRVMIAKALANNPSILILDEPTSGVDSGSTDSLYHLLRDLNSRGMTILLITHDVEQSQQYLNRAIRVEGQSLQEVGVNKYGDI